MYNNKLTAEEIAEMADKGEDITQFLSTPEKVTLKIFIIKKSVRQLLIFLMIWPKILTL